MHTLSFPKAIGQPSTRQCQHRGRKQDSRWQYFALSCCTFALQSVHLVAMGLYRFLEPSNLFLPTSRTLLDEVDEAEGPVLELLLPSPDATTAPCVLRLRNGSAADTLPSFFSHVLQTIFYPSKSSCQRQMMVVRLNSVSSFSHVCIPL